MLTGEIPVLILLIFSLFMVDFIVKKNNLTEKNDYVLLLTTLFLGWFPSIYSNIKIVAIYILILLAFRRIVSLRTLNNIKQKLFDASLYISVAMLFDSWVVIYFIIIYLGIILYVSNDYRNWFIPIVVYAGAVILYMGYQFLTDQSILTNELFAWKLNLNYSTTDTKRIFLHLIILALFSISFVVFLVKYKTFSSQKKLAFLLSNSLFFIGIMYVIFSQDLLLMTEILLLFPLSISTANLLQNIENKRISDALLFLLMIVSFCFYLYE